MTLPYISRAIDLGLYVAKHPKEALVYTIAAGILSLSGCGGNIEPTTNPANTPIKQGIETILSADYSRVMSGLVSPRDYLNDLSGRIAEVKDAQNSGMLTRIIYEPTNKELELLLNESLSGIAEDAQELKSLVQSSIESYQNSDGGDAAVIIPGIVGTFGQKIPINLAIVETLFSSSSINNDADVISIIKHHELKHIEDWYDGITLDNIHLSYDNLSQGTLTIDFLSNLMELRGIYAELEVAFKEIVETGKFSISPQWFGSQAVNYSQYWKFLEEYQATDLEKEVRENQFEQFKGIKPKVGADKISIQFDLFGKKDSVSIKKTR
tara:strand:+ start:1551 stop:2522 length:972 start_codon:yes stop_codon:yes gene_type:complete